MNRWGARTMFFGSPGAAARILGGVVTSGTAAVEFAIFVPLFMILVAGTVDFGYLIYSGSALSAAVSAGSQYTENNVTRVSLDPTGLAADISTIVNNANGTNWATSAVNVNNGNDTTNCYCPTGLPGNWTWGTPMACGKLCASGSIAGQFVTITASRNVSALFPTFGLAYSDTISRSAIVETQ